MTAMRDFARAAHALATALDHGDEQVIEGYERDAEAALAVLLSQR